MKKLFAFLIIGIFLLTCVSASEWDNKKNYNPDLKEVTIENALGFGGDVAKIRLISPLNFEVPRGYQKVAEFELTHYKDDNGGLDLIEFFDKKSSMNKIEREFDYKIKEIEEYEVNDYETICEDNKTGNGECTQKLIGTHTQERVVWNEFNKNDLKKEEKVTIGIFTNVQVGDVVEWIPTFYGVEIDEWASWSESLSTDLISYYKLDESSGNIIDAIGTNNGINYGATTGISGIINTAYDFDGINDYGNMTTLGDIGTTMYKGLSVSIWIKTNASGIKYLIGDSTGGAGAKHFVIMLNSQKTTVLESGTITAGYGGDVGTMYADFGASNTTWLDYKWHHLVVTWNVTGALTEFYLDGNHKTSDYNSQTANAGTDSFIYPILLGNNPGTAGEPTADRYYNGSIDEVGIWNRILSDAEITDLYNEGNGITYRGLEINLNSPEDNYYSASEDITFNCSVNDSNYDIINVSLYINGTINETDSSGINDADYIFTKTLSEGTWNWTCEATNNNSQTIIKAYRDLFIDITSPSVTIDYPTTTIGYGKVGTNETLNWTITDDNIDTCWYEYNNTNTTVTCGDNTTSFVLVEGFTNITFYANDSAGNINTTFLDWSYNVLENNRTHNTTAYETGYEKYSINVTANSSLTAVKLIFNGTSYAMTNAGSGIWNYARDLPSSVVGNNSINFSFTYAGSTIYVDTVTYQYVNYTIFGLCNTSITDDYLNISFKDESNSSVINASISTSTFEYYLGTGTETKTYQLINNTANNHYTFCATPNRTLHIDPYMQYVNTGYPQRIWDPDATDYTSVATNQTLYLLKSADGIYVTFQVVNSADQIITGVEIIAIREIDGTDVEVGRGTTGGDGTVTLWLNPDFSHDFSFSKDGFETYETTFSPTQSSYTITMSGGGTTVADDYTRGILTYIYPTQNELFNDTSYDFEFNLTSSYWDLDSFGFNLRLANGTIVDSDSSTVSGTAASVTYDVNNQSIIYMDYYWIIDGNITSSSKYWVITNTEYEGWSIKTFFTDLDTYLDSGLFGIDNFGRIVIIFLILFMSVGIMSYKFGLVSPMAVTSMIFAIIFFFDVVVGLIPEIRGINYVLTYLAGLILILAVFNEVSR